MWIRLFSSGYQSVLAAVCRKESLLAQDLNKISLILSLQESGRCFLGCLKFLPETSPSDIKGESGSTLCVNLEPNELEWKPPPLSPPFRVVYTHETRIMGHLHREAYYGLRTQHISLPHTKTSLQTLTEKKTAATSTAIGIGQFQRYRSRMWWCSGFLGYLSSQVCSSLQTTAADNYLMVNWDAIK